MLTALIAILIACLPGHQGTASLETDTVTSFASTHSLIPGAWVTGSALVAGSTQLAPAPALEGGARDCRGWLVPDTQAGWEESQRLLGLGWHGLPGDGQEALYSPTC